MRGGLGRRRPLSREAVARRLHVGRQRLARIEHRGLGRLRRADRSTGCGRGGGPAAVTRGGTVFGLAGARAVVLAAALVATDGAVARRPAQQLAGPKQQADKYRSTFGGRSGSLPPVASAPPKEAAIGPVGGSEDGSDFPWVILPLLLLAASAIVAVAVLGRRAHLAVAGTAAAARRPTGRMAAVAGAQARRPPPALGGVSRRGRQAAGAAIVWMAERLRGWRVRSVGPGLRRGTASVLAGRAAVGRLTAPAFSGARPVVRRGALATIAALTAIAALPGRAVAGARSRTHRRRPGDTTTETPAVPELPTPPTSLRAEPQAPAPAEAPPAEGLDQPPAAWDQPIEAPTAGNQESPADSPAAPWDPRMETRDAQEQESPTGRPTAPWDQRIEGPAKDDQESAAADAEPLPPSAPASRRKPGAPWDRPVGEGDPGAPYERLPWMDEPPQEPQREEGEDGPKGPQRRRPLRRRRPNH
jgi:hypothetical protein